MRELQGPIWHATCCLLTATPHKAPHRPSLRTHQHCNIACNVCGCAGDGHEDIAEEAGAEGEGVTDSDYTRGQRFKKLYKLLGSPIVGHPLLMQFAFGQSLQLYLWC